MRQAILAALLLAPLVGLPAADTPRPAKPNILIAIADDLSHVHTSFAGYPAVKTPAIDRVAREGIYFRNAFAPSPGCSPTRASFLTGRHPWQIEQAGTHASSFPAKYVAFPDLLEQAGYFIGMTGKGWDPGDFTVDGRPRNPAGPSFDARQLQPPTSGMNRNDYAANFADFLAARPQDRPFYFWYGASEPHRGYAKGSGLQAGKRLEDAMPPPFLPDTPEVRSDLLDYSLNVLASKQQGRVDPSRTAVYAARERHSSSRYNNWGYPQRAVRTPEYLYIRNFRPDRWPAGDPVVLKDDGTPDSPHSGYKDIDGGPTLAFLVARADDPELGRYLQLAVAKRPAEELFDIRRDPGCLTNLAVEPKHTGVKQKLAKQLNDYLRQTGDPRVIDGGEVWETYKRYSPIRQFPPPVKPPQGPSAGVVAPDDRPAPDRAVFTRQSWFHDPPRRELPGAMRR